MSALSEAIEKTLSEATGNAFEIDGEWIGWPTVAAFVDPIRRELKGFGLPVAARVGFIARNKLGPAAALLAIQADDYTAIPINPFQSEANLVAELKTLDLAGLIGMTQDLQSNALLHAAGQAGVIAIDVDQADPVRVLVSPAFETAPTTEETGLLLATSGTTGVPKRIPIPASAWYATLTATPARPGAAPTVGIQYSPLAHIAGSLTVSGAAVRGGSVVLLEKFTVEGWLDAVRRYRPPQANLPPTMMRMVMTANPDPQDLDSIKVIFSGQAPVDWNLAREFEQKYGLVVLGNYGATEFCGPIASGAPEHREQYGDSKWGSVGKLKREAANARIVDIDTGQELPPGDVGVLEVQVFRMGQDWMRTTDLASLDADDFLYIHGRTDDAIIRGGFKIPPGVISDALKKYPGVADVAVIGQADERLGAVPVAAVEMMPGSAAPAEADLLQFAKANLLSYQAPVAIRVVASLPRTPTMKVDRRRVAELF